VALVARCWGERGGQGGLGKSVSLCGMSMSVSLEALVCVLGLLKVMLVVCSAVIYSRTNAEGWTIHLVLYSTSSSAYGNGLLAKQNVAVDVFALVERAL